MLADHDTHTRAGRVTAAMPRRRSGRQGFTMTELLVVISVIAILAGLLFPAVKIVKDSAKTSQCASNLRQIATGIMSYASDYQNRFPAGQFGASSNQFKSWDDQLSFYDGRDLLAANNTSSGSNNVDLYNNWIRIDATSPGSFRIYAMYSCPMETTVITNSGANCWVRNYAPPTGVIKANSETRARGTSLSTGSYAGLYWPVENSSGGGYPGSSLPYAMDWTAKLASVANPAQKIMLAEIRYYEKGVEGGATGRVVDGPGIQSSSTQHYDGKTGYSDLNCQITYKSTSGSFTPTSDQLLPLHKKSRWNYLFVDGHVELLTENATAMNSYDMWRTN